MRKRILLLVATVLLTGGCLKTQFIDPNTGQVTTAYQINPVKIAEYEKTAQQVRAVAATVATTAAVVTPVFPWAATVAGIATTIAGILGAGLGTWAKIKPKLTEAQTKQSMYYNAAQSVVTAIESYKTTYPEQWTQLELQLAKAIGPEAENVIRSLRGLPPKT